MNLKKAFNEFFEYEHFVNIEGDVLNDLIRWEMRLFYPKLSFAIFIFFYLNILFWGVIIFYDIIFDFDWNSLKMQWSFFSFGTYVTVVYSTVLYKRNAIKDIFKILKSQQPLTSASPELFDKITKDGRLFKSIALFLTVYALLFGSTVYLPWIGDEDKVFCVLSITKKYFNHTISLVCEIIFYLIIYHSVVVMLMQLHCVNYVLFQLKLQLLLLQDKFNNLLNEDVINDEFYQNCVYQELISIIKIHQKIKKFYFEVMDFVYVPLFLYCISGAFLFVGAISFIFMEISPPSNIRMIAMFSMGIVNISTITFNGQGIEDESENLHRKIINLPWHIWDKRNQQLVLNMLINTQTPLVINSSNVITLNNILMLKMYRIVYSTCTFLSSIFY